MDSNRIKNVALGARETLMQEVDAALERVLAPDSPERVANSQAVGTIERTVRDRGRESVVEQVAYTWFNRLCALRYMDVRGYTPVGLVSPRAGETLPAVLADARRGIYAAGLDISQRDKDAINNVLNGGTSARDPLGRAYVMLLVAACKTYERSMDYLFGAGRDLGPAIELLAPTDLLSEGSLLQRICTGLDDATCNEGVEVMGWLYQFYVSERKDAFFASKKKATAADIAPATQLFTPNWIVRYLVENSLGRLWMLNFPNSELKDHMDYYVEPEEPEDDFLKIYSPEDITFLDPACGSGHILVYAFDLLYLMYEEEGYRPADIPELILKNNLTGIEIDDRAAEIASFCLEMKALEIDAEFLIKDVDARVIVTRKFCPTHEERRLIQKLCMRTDFMDTIERLDEIGSLFIPDSRDLHRVQEAIETLADNGSLEGTRLRSSLAELANTLTALSENYSIVTTNPPYMGSGGMNAWLFNWIKLHYTDEKSDLCTCFIKRANDFATSHGYFSLITMHSWMFLDSYSTLRKKIIDSNGLLTLAHLGPHAFDAISGEVVQTVMAVFAGTGAKHSTYYFRLVDEPNSNAKRRRLHSAIHAGNRDICYSGDTNKFSDLPGYVFAYWLSDNAIESFSKKLIADTFISGGRTKTHNNALYLRKWWEVSSSEYMDRWMTYCNGGGYRKWYGLLDDVVDWSSAAIDNYRSHGGLPNMECVDRRALCWGLISSGDPTFRIKPAGFPYSSGSPTIYNDGGVTDLEVLAFLNSSTAHALLNALNPTINTTVGAVASLPQLPFIESNGTAASETAQDNIEVSKEDWDAFETSWGFTWHPLVPSHYEWVDQHTYNMHATERQAGVERIETRYQRWESDCRSRFDQLKANEEELNRIFAHIYGMEGEVPIEVPDDKVSVRLADLGRDIRSLVSYGVGCMFGRYSLDEPGLILADEGSTLDDYHVKVPNPTFEPDRTGIIPITDAETEWFEDDIVAQFRHWLAAAYGQDTLDENVAFIEHALGKSLRGYFVRDFYDDHLKTYQKRPIYWLFQSPKKGLSALIYLHRYNPNTVTTLLTEYIRPLREQMEAQARLLEVTGNARDASTATKYRASIDELDKWEHDVIFPLSQKHVALSLNDGVKANYGKAEFKGALRKVTGLN